MRFLAKILGLAVLHVFAALPSAAMRSVARISAWFMWHADGRLRRNTETNLEICFPDLPADDRALHVRRRLRELSLSILEHGRTWLWQPERLLQDVTRVRGECHLQAAVANDNGVVLLVPHLGNWELANYYVSKRYAVTVMYKEPKAAVFDDFVRQARQRGGSKLISVGHGGVRVLMKSLKAGEMILLLPDQVPSANCGKFALFFDEPTLTMTLATKLLQRTDAKAVFGYCKRQPDGKYEMVFRPPDAGIDDPDCATALAALNKSIERCVMDCPEQYQWQYKRFKILPNLQKRDYSGNNRNPSRRFRQNRVG